jgi:hypothetical protein
MRIWALAALVALTWRAAPCRGHGTPIVVNVAGGRLQVSNGVVDAAGYANWVYADADPESWLVPGPNSTQLTTLPGFDVNDVQVGEELSLEVLSRPDFSQSGRPPRWMWHWNQAAEEVTIAAEDISLDLLSVRGFLPNVSLAQQTKPAPATLKIADLLATDIGEHRHIVLYELDDSGPAELGVYAFFARLNSPSYQPSEPFLIALNAGIEDAMTFQEGALAINAAAGLAGDFDVDGDVDGADFLVWQRTLGAVGAPGTYPAADGSLDGSVNAADLAIWRAEFGREVLYPSELALAGANVPEPCGAAIMASIAAGLLAAGGSRRLTRREPPASRSGLGATGGEAPATATHDRRQCDDA